jgi:hypothetical protein
MEEFNPQITQIRKNKSFGPKTSTPKAERQASAAGITLSER